MNSESKKTGQTAKFLAPQQDLKTPPPEESNLEALKVALPQSAFNSAFVDSGAAQKALPPPAKGFVLPSPQFAISNQLERGKSSTSSSASTFATRKFSSMLSKSSSYDRT
ncbi:MAG: hypothetical protein EZS28_002552 [Streblomastix strix]|uniref:Uncharacterized protein n=1 Tax=Streblomastix strix TaxID=222440 RepID=A0A5J4X3N6_9EUKA|nr:MAG: hypothetical protein EZS28_002552 [Streblomastix strix]